MNRCSVGTAGTHCVGLNGPAVGVLDVTYMEDRSLLPGSFQTDMCFGMYLGLLDFSLGWQSWLSMPQPAPASRSLWISIPALIIYGPEKWATPATSSPRPVLFREEPLFSSGWDIAEFLFPAALLVSSKTAFQGEVVSQNHITHNYHMSGFKGSLLVF